MKNSFLGKRLKAFRYALKGAFLLLRNEASIQVQTALAIIMTIAGFNFEITIVEWMFQIFAIGLVLSIEGLNTAVEEIADFVHPDFHNKIGLIKDITKLRSLLMSGGKP